MRTHITTNQSHSCAAKGQLWLLLPFLLSILYWLYLAFVSQMTIAYDGKEYVRLGYLIAHQGWEEYFKTGPNREPIYPFLISTSLHLETTLHIAYQDIQKIIQVTLLFIAQILLYVLLRRLQIKNWVIFLTHLRQKQGSSILTGRYPITIRRILMGYEELIKILCHFERNEVKSRNLPR